MNYSNNKIRLEDSPSGPYRWCLQEIGDGQVIKKEYVPYTGSLYFDIEELRIGCNISLQNKSELLEKSFHNNEFIYGVLKPSIENKITKQCAEYSFFGTDRHIRDISISISKSEDGVESYKVYASPEYSYEGRDFRAEVQQDTLAFEVVVSAERYELIRKIILSNSYVVAKLRVVGTGFYSQWSPAFNLPNTGSDGYLVKVLSEDNSSDLSSEAQQIIMPSDCLITPPRTGGIISFDLSFRSYIDKKSIEESSHSNIKNQLEFDSEVGKKIDPNDSYIELNDHGNKKLNSDIGFFLIGIERQIVQLKTIVAVFFLASVLFYMWSK